MTFTSELVAVAQAEWDFFGHSHIAVDHTSRIGMKEYEDGGWQRVGDYWSQLGGAYRHLTGKDRNWYWSAAFVSFCMHMAGAADRFRYSAAHCTYINDAIRAHDNGDAAALFTAHSPGDYAPKVGDLVGYWRDDRPISLKTARKIGSYGSHTDIVVEVTPKYIGVIGGNVAQSVTRKDLRISAKGTLIDKRKPWFVVMENRA